MWQMKPVSKQTECLNSIRTASKAGESLDCKKVIKREKGKNIFKKNQNYNEHFITSFSFYNLDNILLVNK